MDKSAYDILGLEVKPDVVKRFAGGGLATGAGAAALFNLVRMIRELKEERDQAKAPSETDENTIVLTLPGKRAEHVQDNAATPPGTSNGMVKRIVGPTVGQKVVPGKPYAANGKGGKFINAYGGRTKDASAGWPTLTLSLLAYGTSAAAAASIVNKVVEKRREHMLQKQLDAAKQEYLDRLQGDDAKQACWLDRAFTLPGSLPKQAQQENVWGGLKSFIDVPLTLFALTSIVGTTGAAYITKRILDEKAKQRDKAMLDVPKVQRIVFRTAPTAAPQPVQSDEEQQKTAEQYGAVQQKDLENCVASLGVMMDKLSSTTKVLNTPYCKAAMVKAGTTPRKLFKLASAIEDLQAYLTQNPELRNMIIRATMEKHPTAQHFTWASKLPGVNRYLDKQFWNRFQQHFAPAKAPAPGMLSGSMASNPKVQNMFSYVNDPDMRNLFVQSAMRQSPVGEHFTWASKIPGIRGLLEQKYLQPSNNSEILANTLGQGKPVLPDDLAKMGGFSDLATSVVGNTIANQTSAEELAAAIVTAQEEAAAKRQQQKATSIDKPVEIAAADPEAEQYVQANRAKIEAILAKLMAERKI